jgi:hypothetical protein
LGFFRALASYLLNRCALEFCEQLNELNSYLEAEFDLSDGELGISVRSPFKSLSNPQRGRYSDVAVRPMGHEPAP